MISSTETIEYGKEIIEFELLQDERKTFAIEVLPTRKVRVKAPQNKNKDEIFQKVHKKAKWISKQKNYFENNYKPITEKQYVSGESFRYLGKQYRLKVIRTNNDSVKLKNGYLYIETCSNSVKKLLDNWYYTKAIKIFSEQLVECFKLFDSYDIELPKIKLRAMKKRWGSYNKEKNIINMNINLIKANKNCINYILIHELCHCIYFSHSKFFYELLDSKCKDWKNLKRKLEITNN